MTDTASGTACVGATTVIGDFTVVSFPARSRATTDTVSAPGAAVKRSVNEPSCALTICRPSTVIVGPASEVPETVTVGPVTAAFGRAGGEDASHARRGLRDKEEGDDEESGDEKTGRTLEVELRGHARMAREGTVKVAAHRGAPGRSCGREGLHCGV